MTDVTIDQLSETSIQDAETYLVAFLQEQYPSMDLSNGRVLRDLLIRPAAIFHALNETNMDRLRQSMSILAIEADPTLADDDIVDGVFSNYRIERGAGTTSTGVVTIVISTLLTTSIPQGTIFTSNGLEFVTAQPYIGVTTADAVVSTSDRLITARNDGTYSFTVPVVAAAAGSEYELKLGTRFSVSPSPANFIDASAAIDFSIGAAPETNAEMVKKFEAALSPKVLSGRTHIDSMVLDLVPGRKETSEIGLGDAEMIRDRHTIFKTSQGGKADIYARLQSLPQVIKVTKTATLISKDTNTWQLTLLRDDAPGFYAVQGILPEGAASDQNSFVISSEVRSLDLSTDGTYVPFIANLTEGAYSRYQTSILQFVDTVTDVTTLIENSSTQDYDVYVSYMPSIATVQDAFNVRATRNPQADYLVRAPIPAFLTVSLTIRYTNDDDVPNAAAIQQAVAARVNALNFSAGRLSASVIHDAAHSVLTGPNVNVVSPVDMRCTILRPDGTTVNLRSSNEIVIPDSPTACTTLRTTAFYLEESGVDVTVVKASTLPV